MRWDWSLAFCFYSDASRIGSKLSLRSPRSNSRKMFPFIRFTNWKQVANSATWKYPIWKRLFPFIRFTNWKQDWTSVDHQGRSHRFHSYASRIGSKKGCIGLQRRKQLKLFPFIRFTNWKQEDQLDRAYEAWQSFHSYASRIGSKTTGSWFYTALLGFHSYASRIGSKLYVVESRTSMRGWRRCFHSYASRIGSKSTL